MYIRLKDGRPFAFAGLWETWRDEKGTEVPSCTIITGQPNELVRPIHDRMAVILREEHYRKWLELRELPPEQLMPLIAEPFPADRMEAYPVSKLVNSPANESADCVKPHELPDAPADAPTVETAAKKRKSPRLQDEGSTLFD